uniref:Uncharacterized protein n=1 Tax=Anguilla anguilla TaxID=7936 RepID=A0A0E9TKY3_ANGAN
MAMPARSELFTVTSASSFFENTELQLHNTII